MRTIHAGTWLLLAGLTAAALAARGPAAVPQAPKVAVGTFDSRAIAIAWVHSDAFRQELGGLRRELEQAQERGDAARVAELEALGPALQAKLHRQGFGAAPVDEILARIADRLPAVAQDAGVDVLVSKWALAWKSPEARFVDVTDRLAAELQPDEDAWKAIHEIVAQEPVPLDELDVHEEHGH